MRTNVLRHYSNSENNHMHAKLVSIAAVALFALATPAFAEDVVSDDVDIALWCGAAFVVASQSDELTAEQAEATETLADLSFAKALVALEADGVEAGEYDRLVEFYVEAAFTDLTTDAEMRYTSDECADLAVE